MSLAGLCSRGASNVISAGSSIALCSRTRLLMPSSFPTRRPASQWPLYARLIPCVGGAAALISGAASAEIALSSPKRPLDDASMPTGRGKKKDERRRVTIAPVKC